MMTVNSLDNIRILRLSIGGTPIEWLRWQNAVCLYARGLVSWTLGDIVATVRGGTSRSTQQQSVMGLHSIVACEGKVVHPFPTTPPLTKRAIFRRDRNLCLYCGKSFPDSGLSRDHVIPRSRNGKDEWTNVVAACKKCNHRKGNALLSECNMELLAVPYEPNFAEYLAIINSHRILGDQMDFLKTQFSSKASFHL